MRLNIFQSKLLRNSETPKFLNCLFEVMGRAFWINFRFWLAWVFVWVELKKSKALSSMNFLQRHEKYQIGISKAITVFESPLLCIWQFECSVYIFRVPWLILLIFSGSIYQQQFDEFSMWSHRHNSNGNGYEANQLKNSKKKSWNHSKWTYFRRIFSHLKITVRAVGWRGLRTDTSSAALASTTLFVNSLRVAILRSAKER